MTVQNIKIVAVTYIGALGLETHSNGSVDF